MLPLIPKHSRLGRMAPVLDPRNLPADEQMAGLEFVGYIGETWSAVLQFDAALRLFLFCQAAPPNVFNDNAQAFRQSRRWKLIAARDGAWAIYNLGRTMENAREEMKNVPTIKEWIDHSKLRQAQKRLRASFPAYESIRNALAHVPDSTKNARNRESNYYQGPFQSDGMVISGNEARIMIKNSLIGNRFQTKFKGMLLSYVLSEESLMELVEIKDSFYDGFPTDAGKFQKL